ncbi:MAG: hypothetical protein GY862_01835 [Gammaproteobacteria bacterium]|nr:hypothetical protein [Gammaproteobacteria bacterium]
MNFEGNDAEKTDSDKPEAQARDRTIVPSKPDRTLTKRASRDTDTSGVNSTWFAAATRAIKDRTIVPSKHALDKWAKSRDPDNKGLGRGVAERWQKAWERDGTIVPCTTPNGKNSYRLAEQLKI